MNYKVLGLAVFSLCFSSLLFSTNCPDPEKSSLKWGVPPSPWVENPYSTNSPQAGENTKFVRAHILVAGYYGRGVVCTYHTKTGDYSIWWNVLTKMPSRIDNNWIDTQSGYVCSQSLTACTFYTAK